jgi:hypothetical protein
MAEVYSGIEQCFIRNGETAIYIDNHQSPIVNQNIRRRKSGA